mgnify:CR=1 FL=1
MIDKYSIKYIYLFESIENRAKKDKLFEILLYILEKFEEERSIKIDNGNVIYSKTNAVIYPKSCLDDYLNNFDKCIKNAIPTVVSL